MNRFRNHQILAVTIFLAAAATGAAAQEPIDLAMSARIRAEGMDRSHVLETFNMLTNVIGPRLTGSPAHKQAADFASAQLTKWGITNSRLEAFPFGRGWTLEQLTLELTAPRYFPLIGYPEAWTPSTNGVITGTPVYIGDKTLEQIQAMGDKLRGAIVLANQPQTAFITDDRLQPANSDQQVRIGAPPMARPAAVAAANAVNAALQRAGAAAVLHPNAGQHGTIFVLGSQRTRDDAVPSIILAAEHYNTIVRLVQAGSPVQLRVESRTKYHDSDTNSYNVLAEIPGVDPVLRGQVVMIGAHLDSWHSSSGGTDNADGAAVAMEAMRILKAVDARPRRTIRIALWSGEEEGLLGSKAYVTQHLAGPANAAARDSIDLYLNDDPGSGPTYGFYMQSNEAAKPIFDAWLEPLKDLGVKRNIIWPIGNTDHLSFTDVGIPGFTAIKDYSEYDTRTHHTNADFYERVHEPDLKQSSVVLAIFAYHAAMRQEKIPR